MDFGNNVQILYECLGPSKGPFGKRDKGNCLDADNMKRIKEFEQTMWDLQATFQLTNGFIEKGNAEGYPKETTWSWEDIAYLGKKFLPKMCESKLLKFLT